MSSSNSCGGYSSNTAYDSRILNDDQPITVENYYGNKKIRERVYEHEILSTYRDVIVYRIFFLAIIIRMF